MNARVALLLLFVFGIADLLSARPAVAVVRGIFIDSDTGRGIPKAQVQLVRRDISFFGNLSRAGKEGVATLLGKTATDSNGRFVFRTSSPGPYEISCYTPKGRRSGIKQLKGAPIDFVTIASFRLPPPPSFVTPPKT